MFTPGPWEVVPKMTHRNEPHAYEIRSDVPHKRFRVIATTPDGFGEACENCGNARLIASAPDLLAACKALATTLGEVLIDFDIDVDASAVLDKARAAISRAEAK